MKCFSTTIDRGFVMTTVHRVSFDVSFDQRLNKRMSKQSIRWWFETPSRLLWAMSRNIFVAVRMNEIRNTRRSIHRWTMDFLHKGPVTRKMFPFDDVIMKGEHGPDLNPLVSDPGKWSKFLSNLMSLQRNDRSTFPVKICAYSSLWNTRMFLF